MKELASTHIPRQGFSYASQSLQPLCGSTLLPHQTVQQNTSFQEEAESFVPIRQTWDHHNGVWVLYVRTVSVCWRVMPGHKKSRNLWNHGGDMLSLQTQLTAHSTPHCDLCSATHTSHFPALSDLNLNNSTWKRKVFPSMGLSWREFGLVWTFTSKVVQDNFNFLHLDLD